MSTTPELLITDIAAAQSQKEVTHNSAIKALEDAFCLKVSIAVTTADVTLTDSQHNRNFCFEFTGAMTGARSVIFKARNRLVMVKHACTGGHNITIKSGSGAGSTVALAPGDIKFIYVDGDNNAAFTTN